MCDVLSNVRESRVGEIHRCQAAAVSKRKPVRRGKWMAAARESLNEIMVKVTHVSS